MKTARSFRVFIFFLGVGEGVRKEGWRAQRTATILLLFSIAISGSRVADN